MARLSRLLGLSQSPQHCKAPKEEARWLVGGRYEVLQPTALREKPYPTSDVKGHLQLGDVVLVLALRVQGKVRLGYLANTRKPDWVAGWCKIESVATPQQQHGGGQVAGDAAVRRATLHKQRLQGSWEVGGRYRVIGSPVLRVGIELESEMLWECAGGDQAEVLVLDLGLVLLEGAPRLRAHVRTDSGYVGWITVESHGASRPLLDPLNLHSEEAAVGNFTSMIVGLRKFARRRKSSKPPAAGEKSWVVHGKYRTLARLQLSEGPELDSRVVSTAKKGDLVFVRQTCMVTRQQGDSRLRLQVSLDKGGGHIDSAAYWLSPMSISGEAWLDFRDHLEYDRLLRSGFISWSSSARGTSSPRALWYPPAASSAGAGLTTTEPASTLSGMHQFVITIDRRKADNLGLEIDQQDGMTVEIDAIQDGPVQAWNAAHPEAAVQIGDRIVSVNGRCGDAGTLVDELCQRRLLRVTLQRPVCCSNLGGIGTRLEGGQVGMLAPVKECEADGHDDEELPFKLLPKQQNSLSAEHGADLARDTSTSPPGGPGNYAVNDDWKCGNSPRHDSYCEGGGDFTFGGSSSSMAPGFERCESFVAEGGRREVFSFADDDESDGQEVVSSHAPDANEARRGAAGPFRDAAMSPRPQAGHPAATPGAGARAPCGREDPADADGSSGSATPLGNARVERDWLAEEPCVSPSLGTASASTAASSPVGLVDASLSKGCLPDEAPPPRDLSNTRLGHSPPRAVVVEAWRQLAKDLEASPEVVSGEDDEEDVGQAALACGATKPCVRLLHGAFEERCGDLRPFCDLVPDSEDRASAIGGNLLACGSDLVGRGGGYFQFLFGVAFAGVAKPDKQPRKSRDTCTLSLGKAPAIRVT